MDIDNDNKVNTNENSKKKDSKLNWDDDFFTKNENTQPNSKSVFDDFSNFKFSNENKNNLPSNQKKEEV